MKVDVRQFDGSWLRAFVRARRPDEIEIAYTESGSLTFTISLVQEADALRQHVEKTEGSLAFITFFSFFLSSFFFCFFLSPFFSIVFRIFRLLTTHDAVDCLQR
jgi:hypothetical protein